MPKRNLILLLLVGIVALAAIWYAYYVQSARQKDQAAMSSIRQARDDMFQQALFWKAMAAQLGTREPDPKVLADLISRAGEQYALQPEQRDAVIEGGLRGMVEAYGKEMADPYCRYVNRQEKEAFEGRIQGYEWGAGLRLAPQGERLRIAAVMGESPAHCAGAAPGDILLAINGLSVDELDAVIVRRKLDNREGTPVEMRLLRNRPLESATRSATSSSEPVELTISLAPGRFEVHTVEGLCRNPQGGWVYTVGAGSNIGYLRLTEMVTRSCEQLREALRSLPVGVKGLVLDLRGNPGGMPESAAEVADLFVPSGLMFSIVSTRAAKVQRHPFVASGEGTYSTEVPIVVLIDAQTASAAEIVAGTLRAHNRAVIVGTPSHGKVDVQSVTPVSGYGLIVMSTGKFYLATGKPDSAGIRIKRILPDVLADQQLDNSADLARLRASVAAMPELGASQPTTMPADQASRQFLRLDAPLASAVEILGDPVRYEKLVTADCNWLRSEP